MSMLKIGGIFAFVIFYQLTEAGKMYGNYAPISAINSILTIYANR